MFLSHAVRAGFAALALAATFAATPARADFFDVLYTITLNPDGSTTLENSATSAGQLPFFTRLGPALGTWLGLDPGSTVTVDRDGEITSGGMPWDFADHAFLGACKNEKHENKDWTITAGSGGAIVSNRTNMDYVILTRGESYDVPRCNRVLVRGDYTATGCLIESLSDDTEMEIFAPVMSPTEPSGWPFDPTQERVRLFSGALSSADNTGVFISIFTDTVITGCPEPSSLILSGLGAAGLLGFRRRLWISAFRGLAVLRRGFATQNEPPK